MKVLVVIPDSNVGGITSSAVNFCNELSKRGEEVFLLDMSGKYLCNDNLEPSVKKGSLTGKSTNWNISNGSLRQLTGFQKIKQLFLGAIKKLTIRSGLWYRLIFKKYKEFGAFDVAIAFRQCAPCYSFVLNKVKANNKMGFVHGELTFMGDISSWQKYMQKFTKIAYVSNAVKEQFIKAYPYLENNACTIYNMFDEQRILKLAQEKNPFSFDKDKINIVTVSRIDNAFKRIDLIPEICKRLKTTSNKPFHWYIVGDGPDLDNTKAKINSLGVQDLCTLIGKKENPFAILKDADFSVLLSKSESYGMVVRESFILNVPVVVANYPALKEIMQDNVHGYVTEQDIESVYTGVLRMMECEQERLKFIDNIKKMENDNSIAYKQFVETVN